MRKGMSGPRPLRVICLLGDDLWQDPVTRLRMRRFLEKQIGTENISPIFLTKSYLLDVVIKEDILKGVAPDYFVTDFIADIDHDHRTLLSEEALRCIFGDFEGLDLSRLKVNLEEDVRWRPEGLVARSVAYFKVVSNPGYAKAGRTRRRPLPAARADLDCFPDHRGRDRSDDM